MVKPSIKVRWVSKNTSVIGTNTITEAVAIKVYDVEYLPINKSRATVNGLISIPPLSFSCNHMPSSQKHWDQYHVPPVQFPW